MRVNTVQLRHFSQCGRLVRSAITVNASIEVPKGERRAGAALTASSAGASAACGGAGGAAAAALPANPWWPDAVSGRQAKTGAYALDGRKTKAALH